MSDWRLLDQYVRDRSEPAFGQLLDRHIKMVYWTCYRELGSSQQAEDATQEVFLLLARKASTLNRDVSLSGWLFNTSRLVCRNFERSEGRRKRLEEEARRVMEVSTSPDQQWQGIEPLLNDALAALTSIDRDVVLRRYIDGYSIVEIAAETHSTENAIGKRAARAIEKLRSYMLSRGATVTSIALASLLAERAARAAPVSLKNATLAAIRNADQAQSSHPAAHSQSTIINTGVKAIMALSKGKIAAIVVGSILVAGGITGTVFVGKLRSMMPPSNLAVAFSEYQAKASRDGSISEVSAMPFYVEGADKPVGLVWMVYGDAKVSADGASGKMAGSTNPALVSSAYHRHLMEMLLGMDMQQTENAVSNPQLAISVNGVTSYESGFGTHTIKDNTGRVIETMQVQPQS